MSKQSELQKIRYKNGKRNENIQMCIDRQSNVRAKKKPTKNFLNVVQSAHAHTMCDI